MRLGRQGGSCSPSRLRGSSTAPLDLKLHCSSGGARRGPGGEHREVVDDVLAGRERAGSTSRRGRPRKPREMKDMSRSSRRTGETSSESCLMAALGAWRRRSAGEVLRGQLLHGALGAHRGRRPRSAWIALKSRVGVPRAAARQPVDLLGAERQPVLVGRQRQHLLARARRGLRRGAARPGACPWSAFTCAAGNGSWSAIARTSRSVRR